MTQPTDPVVAELRVLTLEMRAGFAESRARDAELGTRLSTLIDSVADLRREYNEHWHGEQSA